MHAELENELNPTTLVPYRQKYKQTLVIFRPNPNSPSEIRENPVICGCYIVTPRQKRRDAKGLPKSIALWHGGHELGGDTWITLAYPRPFYGRDF